MVSTVIKWHTFCEVEHKEHRRQNEENNGENDS